MADKKITELSNVDTAAADDIVMIVEGPLTSNPANKKITFANTPTIAKSYTVAGLPQTGIAVGQLVWVTDQSGGAQLAVCTDASGTGTWALVTDGTTAPSTGA